MDGKNSRINCFDCVHFSITWEAKYPKSCGFYGFKTASIPSDVVFRSTGQRCAGFSSKKK
jgi:hypothetical protein